MRPSFTPLHYNDTYQLRVMDPPLLSHLPPHEIHIKIYKGGLNQSAARQHYI